LIFRVLRRTKTGIDRIYRIYRINRIKANGFGCSAFS